MYFLNTGCNLLLTQYNRGQFEIKPSIIHTMHHKLCILLDLLTTQSFLSSPRVGMTLIVADATYDHSKIKRCLQATTTIVGSISFSCVWYFLGFSIKIY